MRPACAAQPPGRAGRPDRGSPPFPGARLVEFDVGQASSRLAESQPPVSWTGFVIATMARAVALHPEVNAKNAKFLTRGMLWPAVGANAPMG